MFLNHRVQAKRLISEIILDEESLHNSQIHSKYAEIVLGYQSLKEKLATMLFEVTRDGKKFKLDSESEIREVNPVKKIQTKESERIRKNRR